MDNFNLKKFLIENKLTPASQQINELKYSVKPSKKGFSVVKTSTGDEITSFDTEEKAKQHVEKLNKMKFIPKEKFNEETENKMTQPSQMKEGLKYLAHHLSAAKNRLGSEPKDLVQSWLKSIKDELKSGETKYNTYQAEDWLNHYKEFSKGDPMRNVRGMGRADKPFMKRNPNKDTLE